MNSSLGKKHYLNFLYWFKSCNNPLDGVFCPGGDWFLVLGCESSAALKCPLGELSITLEKTGKNWGWEKSDGGWDGWLASLTQRTWVWTNSRRWWRTGKPGVLQSMGLKRLDTTEQLNNKPLLSLRFRQWHQVHSQQLQPPPPPSISRTCHLPKLRPCTY